MNLLCPDDEMALTSYFSGAVLSFERSTMGSMLDMQAARYRDSEGHRVLRAEDPWLCIHLREARSEACYEPDIDAILWLARISRRLDAVSRQCPIVRDALEVYYGSSGQFWKRVAHKQEWSLVDLTASGADFLRRRQARANKLGTRIPTSAAAELAAESELQDLAPNPDRQTRLQAVDAEVRMLLRLMEQTWKQTDTGRSFHEKA